MIFIQISHKALRYSPVMPDNHFSFPVIFKGKLSQWACGAKMTSYQRRCVNTSHRH